MPFTPSSSSILSSGGAVVASDLTVDGTTITVDEAADSVGIGTTTPGAKLEIQDTTTSTANTGGSLRLSANDGAPMGDSHRLGVIEFTGAEDGSNTQVTGARIEAITDAAWTNVENGCALYFYTTDADAVQTNVLKIDSNKKSTFAGNVQVNADLDLTGALSFDGAGAAITSIDTDLSSVAGTDTTLASAKAIKTYIDATATASDLDATTDSGTIDIDLDSETLTVSGGEGINTSATGTTITIAAEDSSASNKGAVIVAGGTDCTVSYSSGTATVAVDNLAASKLTSGTLADARVAASNVTQHQGSIVGVGALDSGSITSGFTSIDVGSGGITTTGAVGTGPLTTALSSATGILINQDYSNTDAATVVGLDVDFDKTGASTSNNTLLGLRVDMDATESTDGTNEMIGAKLTPTCSHAANAGTVMVKGLEIVATGSTPGGSTCRGIDLTSTGADFNQGLFMAVQDGGVDIKMLSSANGADFCTMKTGANGATVIETVDGSGADADLTFTVDGAVNINSAGAVAIESTAGALSIGADNVDQAVNVATAGTRTLNIGILDGTDTTTIVSKGNQTHTGTVTVGVNDTGHDVQFYGDTAGASMLWDASTDDLSLLGAAGLSVAGITSLADTALTEGAGLTMMAPSLPSTDHTSTGLSAQMLAGGEILAFQTVCISTTAGDVIVSDSNAIGTMPVVGIATAAISNDAVGTVLLNGFIRDDSWSWTAGSILYASETAGAMTHTAPTTSGAFVQPLGVALTATVVLFQPSLSVVEVA